MYLECLYPDETEHRRNLLQSWAVAAQIKAVKNHKPRPKIDDRVTAEFRRPRPLPVITRDQMTALLAAVTA
jgi:hypothetical protein